MTSYYNATPPRALSVSLYLQQSVFCFSSSFSSSGSAPSQHLQSAAACPWSSRCRRSSDWGSPEERQSSFIQLFLTGKQLKVTWKWWGGRTTSLSARRKERSDPPLSPFAVSKRSSAIFTLLSPTFGNSALVFTPASRPHPLLHISTSAQSPSVLWRKNFLFLTSEPGVRWRVDRRGVWSVWEGWVGYLERFEHLVFALSRPAGEAEAFSSWRSKVKTALLFMAAGRSAVATRNALQQGLKKSNTRLNI